MDFCLEPFERSGSPWGHPLRFHTYVQTSVGSLPCRKSACGEPTAKRTTGLFYSRSAWLCLSGHLWAFQGLSKPASPPASQLASQLIPPANQPASSLVIILLVGGAQMVLECTVLYCSVLFCTVLVLEWSCSGPGMFRECYWWSWNGPGLYCSVLFCTVLYVMFWSWNPGRKSACGEPPWS